MKRLREDDIAKLIVLLSVLFGGWLRFMPVLQAGFPINDGGMFYTMINDLHANHFMLPKFTTYNLLDIPYAYPPLAFYLGAAIKGIFNIETIQILMYLPPALSTLSILAFLIMARQFFPDSWPKTALATMAFALLPRSYSWFIMGGGLTRSLGQIFLLLMLASTLRLYKFGKKEDVWRTGLLGGLVVLSHPEATVHAIAAAALFWLFLSRNRRGIINSLWVATIVIIVSSPWWATILAHHGLSPLLSAGQTGGHSLYRLASIFAFTFAEERLASVVTVLGMIGMIMQLSRRNYFLSVWMVIHFIAQPRSATAIAIYPLALLSAIALYDMIFPTILSLKTDQRNKDWTGLILSQRSIQLVFAGLFSYLVLASFLYSIEMAPDYLSKTNREAMKWIQENTPSDSHFLVLEDAPDIARQTGNEWFPALAKRRSELTLQGREWLLFKDFTNTMDDYSEIQACLHQDVYCINAKETPMTYDYLYLQLSTVASSTSQNSQKTRLFLAEELKFSNHYQLVYQNQDVEIYQKKP